MSQPSPKPEGNHFPDIGCTGECGFVSAGFGLQCLEGSACGRYLHPGDKHYAEVTAYYRRAKKESK